MNYILLGNLIYTIFLLLVFPTPIIPPIAPEVTKIRSLINVDAPGAEPNAAIPMIVNRINNKKPHIVPIISPFFVSFFAAWFFRTKNIIIPAKKVIFVSLYDFMP